MTSSLPESPQSLFSYLNYRSYLKDVYLTRKKHEKGFTFQKFAELTGFTTSSYFHLVITGKRDISTEAIDKITAGLGLKGRERRYFEALVEFNQAKNDEERARTAEKLAQIRPTEDIKPLDDPQYAYLTRTHYAIIREMTALPDFEESAEWIIDRILFPLTPKKVGKAVRDLIQLKLLTRTLDGKLIQTDTSLCTEIETTAAESYKYHTFMLESAKDALWNVDPKDRDFNAVTIPIQKELIPQIKQRVNMFLDDIVRLINACPGKDYDEVYQLSYYLFPLTKKKTKIMRSRHDNNDVAAKSA